ncbi:hypothetical protein ACFWGN_17945 [Oerskovia sp. NPDC060338]|uniref:hypothetical protein n=1 Tax=Oerskovia sp. NPDC060338 TaxID=3347100 RepID=UPI00365CFE35
MKRLPSVQDYEHMTLAVRRQAAALAHEQAEALRHRRARLAQLRAEHSPDDVAETRAAAEAMLPDIIARFGDTPALTTGRRAAMQSRRRRHTTLGGTR